VTDRQALAYHASFAQGQESEWYGVEGRNRPFTLAALFDLAQSGWKHGSDKLQQTIEKLTPPTPINIRRKPRWGESGEELNVDRALLGQWDAAWRYTPRCAVGAGKRNVTVVVDCIAPGVTDADEMFWRGAAATALADCLSEAGYAVQLVSAFKGTTMGMGDDVVARVIVKPYSAPFDQQTAAAAMALPGFFRGFAHAWGFGHLKLGKQIMDGGWYAEDLNEADVADLSDGAAMFVAHQNIRSAKDAQEWVEGCVTNLQPDAGNLGTE
jgi:hypothetical protein